MKTILITTWFLLLCCSHSGAATQIGEDGSLVAFNNGTVVDSQTNLMWSQADNGKDFSWLEATIFAESLNLEAYDDWRLPTKVELAKLFREETNSNGLNISPLFQLESIFLYASDSKRCKAAFANLTNGSFNWVIQSRPDFGRVLVVRTNN